MPIAYKDIFAIKNPDKVTASDLIGMLIIALVNTSLQINVDN